MQAGLVRLRVEVDGEEAAVLSVLNKQATLTIQRVEQLYCETGRLKLKLEQAKLNLKFVFKSLLALNLL